MAADFDIIIPHFGRGELTRLCLQCLESIRLYSALWDYRIILVDNGSAELDEVHAELEKHPKHSLIRNTENIGFVKATNQGLYFSDAAHVILMNNDTEAMPGWLPLLASGLAVHQCVGLSGPLTNTDGSWQGKWKRTAAPVHILGVGRMLAFFCVMIARRVLETKGLELLSEDYGVGFGDDDDYCRRAERAGFRLALVQDLVIPHHHRSTFKALYTEDEIKRMQATALAHFHATK